MSLLKSKFLKALALGSVLMVTATAHNAVAETKLRMGWTTSEGERDPYAITARNIAAELEKRMPGKFKASMFPNNQLGDEKQMMEGLSFGTLDLGVITNAGIANVYPAFQLNDMPFIYPSKAAAHEVLDGEVGQELFKTMQGKGVVGLGFSEGGYRHMINNVRPITAPADVTGVKFRVQPNPVFLGMFKSLGGNAIPMAWGETFTAVQQGTIDGLEAPLAVIAANKYADITKYLSLTSHTYSGLGVLVSDRFYKKLTDEEKVLFQDAVTAAIKDQRQQVQANEEVLIEQLKASGMQVNEVADVAVFSDKVTPVYEEFRQAIGGDLLDKARAQAQAANK